MTRLRWQPADSAEPVDRYRGLLRDTEAGPVLARGRHQGRLLAGMPEGYLRRLLELSVAPAVRLRVLEALGEVESPPFGLAGEEWVPFLLGDLGGWVHRDVAALFVAEYDRIARLAGSREPTVALEYMAAMSSTTPSASLR